MMGLPYRNGPWIALEEPWHIPLPVAGTTEAEQPVRTSDSLEPWPSAQQMVETSSSSHEQTNSSSCAGIMQATSSASTDGKRDATRQRIRQEFRKTRWCRFVELGCCTKGDTCEYAHSSEELKPPPDFTKTSLCTDFKKGVCKKGANCKFAHSKLELRSTPAFRLSSKESKAMATGGGGADTPGASTGVSLAGKQRTESESTAEPIDSSSSWSNFVAAGSKNSHSSSGASHNFSGNRGCNDGSTSSNASEGKVEPRFGFGTDSFTQSDSSVKGSDHNSKSSGKKKRNRRRKQTNVNSSPSHSDESTSSCISRTTSPHIPDHPNAIPLQQLQHKQRVQLHDSSDRQEESAEAVSQSKGKHTQRKQRQNAQRMLQSPNFLLSGKQLKQFSEPTQNALEAPSSFVQRQMKQEQNQIKSTSSLKTSRESRQPKMQPMRPEEVAGMLEWHWSSMLAASSGLGSTASPEALRIAGAFGAGPPMLGAFDEPSEDAPRPLL